MSEKTKPRFKAVKNNPNIRVRENANGTKSFAVKAYDPSIRRTVHIGSFDSLKEAKQAKRKFEEREHSGWRYSRMTVREYSNTWLDRHRDRRKESTQRTYRYGVRKFVEQFGETRIRDLHRMDCVDWARDQDDWAVNPSRIMLSDMIRDELLDRNPLADLRRPTSRGRDNYPPLGSSEVKDLLSACFVELRPEIAGQVAGVIACCAYLGLRKSEAFALSGRDVNVSEGIVCVENQVGKHREFMPPKHGRREIALTSQAQQALERFGANLEARTMFGHSPNKCFTPGSFEYQFSKVRSALGFRGLTMHELRHFHSTWLKFLGVPESSISLQLGHSLPGLRVTNLYIHSENFDLKYIREKTSGNPPPLPIDKRAGFTPPPRGGGGPS